MTITKRSTTVGGYYIEIELNGSGTPVYRVIACPIHGDYVGYPESDNRYTDLAKATRQYNALVRRYREE